MPQVKLVKGELTGVASYVWDSSILDWVRATGSTVDGTEVTVTNFPSGLSTSANQLTMITELQEISQAVGGAETTRVDEASSTVTYVGKAVAGTAESSASWKITKITISGTITEIEFADGNSNYDNVWNNRASLSYS